MFRRSRWATTKRKASLHDAAAIKSTPIRLKCTSPAEATAVQSDNPSTHAITFRDGYSTPRQ